jgi:hypothetical protein
MYLPVTAEQDNQHSWIEADSVPVV